jgi:hypothetical protein
MKCEDLEELISAYADGELAGVQRDFVEEHMTGCADCQSRLADYRKTGERLLSLRVTPSIPDIKQAIMSKINVVRTPVKLRRWLRPVLIAIPFIIALIIFLTLFFTGSFSDYKSVLAKAYAATEKIESYRKIVDWYTHQYFYSEDEFDYDRSFEVEYSAPESYHLIRYNIKLDTRSFFNEIIVIGDQAYYRGDYVPPLSPSRFTEDNPTKEYTLELLDLLIDVKTMPDENIDGIDCYHYRGTLDMGKMWEKDRPRIEEMVGKSAKSMNLNDEDIAEWLKNAEDSYRKMETCLELWIDKNDYLIRKQVVNITQEPNSHLPTYKVIDKYYDFNQPITIEPPLTESGELLEGWRIAPIDDLFW